MIKVEFTDYPFRIKKENDKDFIFDEIRKLWVKLTPEEWVRQNFIQYLISKLHYPAAYIAVEKEIQLGELKKRFDILIYDRVHQPLMMIECKAPEIPLDEKVLQQLLRYTITIPVSFFIITNGHYTNAWEKISVETTGNKELKALSEMPVWKP
jgi:hypothetical protein